MLLDGEMGSGRLANGHGWSLYLAVEVAPGTDSE